MSDTGTVPPPITVLLVDDHDLIREGLTGAFGLEPATRVVGAAKTVTEALTLYAELLPDVVVTDLQLPDGTGLDVVRTVRRETANGGGVGLVVLTMHSGDEHSADPVRFEWESP